VLRADRIRALVAEVDDLVAAVEHHAAQVPHLHRVGTRTELRSGQRVWQAQREYAHAAPTFNSPATRGVGGDRRSWATPRRIRQRTPTRALARTRDAEA